MGSHTDLDQDNIMVTDYGELPEVDRQAFETQLEDLRRKMASCYRKTRQGVIKQEEFMLLVDIKSKVTIDSSNAPVHASEVAQIVDGAVIASLNNRTTLEKTLDARMSELENRLNSRFLGGASISYNNKHMCGIPSDFHVPKFPIQQNWPMNNTYNSLGTLDPRFTPAAPYASSTIVLPPTGCISRLDRYSTTGPTGGIGRSNREAPPVRPLPMSFAAFVPNPHFVAPQNSASSIDDAAADPSLCPTEAQHKPAAAEQTERWQPVRGKEKGEAVVELSGETELNLSHLTSVKQKYNELVSEYIRRFRDTRNRCYSLTLSDKDLVDLAYYGLLEHLKEANKIVTRPRHTAT
uniref:Uncharacterized protein n=1 Tax=Oryza punctata TaxID=4537 RepID=A0A0E0KI78_ORYPU